MQEHISISFQSHEDHIPLYGKEIILENIVPVFSYPEERKRLEADIRQRLSEVFSGGFRIASSDTFPSP